jgi:hypothetical protein
MRRLVFAATLAACCTVLVTARAHALLSDHLQCFKIKDSQAKASYIATLTPGDGAFPVAPGCKVQVPAKMLCVDVEKSAVTPTPPGSGPGAQAQKYLCYKAKCAKSSQTVPVSDQFGSRSVLVKSTSLLCAPFPAPTTTTTTTSTTTTTMGGCTTNGDCPSPQNATGQCVASQCTFACLPGFLNCNSLAGDGCEVNSNGDPTNCGGCGMVCSSSNITPACTGGSCTGTCSAGFADCNGNKRSDGCEVNLQGDPNNCAGCGTTCSSNNVPVRSCTAGQCNGACSAGFADCNNNEQIDGCETSIVNNPSNCGGCGLVCPVANPTCVGQVCM